jgi:hypothetical protein
MLQRAVSTAVRKVKEKYATSRPRLEKLHEERVKQEKTIRETVPNHNHGNYNMIIQL